MARIGCSDKIIVIKNHCIENSSAHARLSNIKWVSMTDLT